MSGRVIALGFFDGVHLGHGALLKETVRLSGELHCVSAALSFAGCVAGKSPLLLNTVEDRAELIRRLWQVEEVLLLQFDETLMHMEPEAFVRMLAEKYEARHLVAGYDFTYGYRGAGNARTLSCQCGEMGIAAPSCQRWRRTVCASAPGGSGNFCSRAGRSRRCGIWGIPMC